MNTKERTHQILLVGPYTRPRCLHVVARRRLPSSRRSARASTVRVFASLCVALSV